MPHSALPSLGCILLFAERTPLLLRVLGGWNIHVPCPSCYSHSGSGAWWLRNVNLATRGSHTRSGLLGVGFWLFVILCCAVPTPSNAELGGVWGIAAGLLLCVTPPVDVQIFFLEWLFLRGLPLNRKAGIHLSSALRVGAYRVASLMVAMGLLAHPRHCAVS